MSAVSGIVPNPFESWRNYNKRVSLHSCRLSMDDLKKLYKIVNEKQNAMGQSAVAALTQISNETPQDFRQRQVYVQNSFITTARITGFNNETVSGHGEGIFDSALLPGNILSIEYDTKFSPQAQLKIVPKNNVVLFLDFSRPTIFSRGLPTEPTPNNSNWVISAESEEWSTSLNARLEEFFDERRTVVHWLHQPNTYDALLLLVGVPWTLWATSRVGHAIIDRLHLASTIQTAVFIYLFFLFVNGFRWVFSYGRWVYPKVELESVNSTSRVHRAVWSAIVIGLIVAALWDAIKAFAA